MQTLNEVLEAVESKTNLIDGVDALLAGLQAQIAAKPAANSVSEVFDAAHVNIARIVTALISNTELDRRI